MSFFCLYFGIGNNPLSFHQAIGVTQQRDASNLIAEECFERQSSFVR
jgi:hypothetical protein